MAQHHWLRQRALHLESSCYDPATGQITDQKQPALLLRYQTTHERAFHKALNELLKLRAARQKEQIGFESQQRKQERHKWDILLAEAKVDGQQLHDLNRDIKDSERLRVYMKSSTLPRLQNRGAATHRRRPSARRRTCPRSRPSLTVL